MPPYLSFALFVGVALATFGGMLGLSHLIGPKRPNPVKDDPFECGMPALAPLPRRMHVRFFRVAMLFVVFDIETVLILPWAVAFGGRMTPFAFAELAFFVAMLAFGLAYVWTRGGLEWD